MYFSHMYLCLGIWAARAGSKGETQIAGGSGHWLQEVTSVTNTIQSKTQPLASPLRLSSSTQLQWIPSWLRNTKHKPQYLERV